MGPRPSMRVSSKFELADYPIAFHILSIPETTGRFADAPQALQIFPQLKGLPAACIALLPQISALLCLCLKFHLSKMFATQQVSLKAPTFGGRGEVSSFWLLFCLCTGNLSLCGIHAQMFFGFCCC